MSQPTPAIFSSESETRKHVERMQREREAFQAWWSQFNEDRNLKIPHQHLAWESWKAAARVNR